MRRCLCLLLLVLLAAPAPAAFAVRIEQRFRHGPALEAALVAPRRPAGLRFRLVPETEYWLDGARVGADAFLDRCGVITELKVAADGVTILRIKARGK